MSRKYFLAKTIELSKGILLSVFFDKNIKFEELFECQLRLRVYLTEDQYCQRQFLCRYVNDDKMITIDELEQLVEDNLIELTKLIESVDSGISNTEHFSLEQPSLVSTSVETRKDVKKALQNITKYKLQPFIIDLYNSVLVKYKGTDTLQKRKLQKMIEAQEDALRFYQSGGRLF